MLSNLKVLQFEYPYSLDQDWAVLGNSLRQRLTLHTIHFPSILRREAHSLFRGMVTPGSPKLNKLVMPLSFTPLDNEDLRLVEAQEDFLRSQSDNLEVLTLAISFQNLNGNVPIQHKRQFPVMKYLKTANFYILTYIEPWSYPYVPLEPEHLPKLKTLRLVPKIMESEVFADSPFLSVEEVKLRRWSPGNIGLLSKIGSRFPNLRKLSGLKIGVNVNAIETIITNFPDIEDVELKIFDGPGERIQNFSLIISGIPAEKWALAQEHFANAAGYESLPSWIEPPGPSLRDLKRLKRLLLCAFPQKRPRLVRIDEVGVYLTFLRLSPQLNLTFRGLTISDELAAKLTEYYQNIYFLPAQLKETK